MLMRFICAAIALLAVGFLAGRLGIGSPPAAPVPPGPVPMISVSTEMGSALCVNVLPLPSELEKKLDTRLAEVTFDLVPFDEAIQRLAKQAGVNVVVNWPALARSGVAPDTPINLRLKDIALADAMTHLLTLGSLDRERVGFDIRGNVFVVDGSSGLYAMTALRIYNVTDIILAEQERHYRLKGTSVIEDTVVEEIARLIMDTVLPDSWRENGGLSASIREISGRFVIQQTRAGHRQIEAILAGLRATGGLPATRPENPATQEAATRQRDIEAVLATLRARAAAAATRPATQASPP